MVSSKIGIGLEFLVAHPDRSIETPMETKIDQRWPEGPDRPARLHESGEQQVHKATDNCVVHVCKVIADTTGFPVACQLPYTWTGSDKRVRQNDAVVIDFGDDVPHLAWNSMALPAVHRQHRYAHWLVTSQLNLSFDLAKYPMQCAPAGYQWHGIEVNSPIIFHAADFANRLPHLAAVLYELAADTKIWLNSNVGLHVHAGAGANTLVQAIATGSLDIKLARRVAALALLIEDPVLYGMAHPCRRFSPDCPPIGEQSMIAESKAIVYETVPADSHVILYAVHQEIGWADPKPRRDLAKLFRMLAEILTQPKLQDLRRALGVMDNDSSPSDSVSRTGLDISSIGLEFRYPEASFDLDYINFWVSLTRRLIKIARRPVDEFVDTLRQILILAVGSGAEPPIWEWMEVLGLEKWSGYCKQRQKEYTKNLLELDKQTIVPFPDRKAR